MLSQNFAYAISVGKVVTRKTLKDMEDTIIKVELTQDGVEPCVCATRELKLSLLLPVRALGGW
jgi:hypothetical protein